MENKIGKLIVVRHGESEWNKANLFTGKVDVHLSPAGFRMAGAMGALAKDIKINHVFASMQIRSIETEVCFMEGTGQYCPKVTHSSALNERDYGDFTGTNKIEEEKLLGKEEIADLRRAWNHPVPNGETLKMVYERVVPFFQQEILPILNQGKNVLVVSHGNTIRALAKYIEKISDENIEKVEMPFDEIFVYKVDKDGYLLDKQIRKVQDVVGPVSENKIRSSVKIVATIGPASEQPQILNEMIKLGMDIARLNFFWAKPEEDKKRIQTIRELAEKNKLNILIIEDLPGPRVQDKDGHTYNLNVTKSITDNDKELIKFGVENNVDYISISFVGDEKDVIDCREEIKKHGGKQKIIAKIEREKAIKNLDKIIEAADGIMIARGDLGNEIPLEKIPFVQEEIIKKCKNAGKPVITATQMLYSMKDSPSPTRAEATDVVNAVLEGSDAVMLSEETASGKYPIRAVHVMEHLVLEAEKHLANPKFNKF
jgi:bisphosphoglycerate-dependent phosphoglycerate mutase